MRNPSRLVSLNVYGIKNILDELAFRGLACEAFN